MRQCRGLSETVHSLRLTLCGPLTLGDEQVGDEENDGMAAVYVISAKRMTSVQLKAQADKYSKSADDDVPQRSLFRLKVTYVKEPSQKGV